MIEIRTFLRNGSGLFLPVEDVDSIPEDSEYIEGALEVNINGTQILTTREWGYIDQLWAYIARMLDRLSHGAEAAQT